MMRKSLFFILVLALLSVPVFLMAHAFTHFAQIEATSVTDAESLQVENEDDIDIDDICFDCLALTALGTILITSGFFRVDQAACQLIAQLKTWHDSRKKSSLYCPRAPPINPFLIS
ncbi:MAG: hypothetical protein Q8K59_06380 [Nitrosomonas sp.]|nr:hypothetical protein [Nitrosomonas sp.]MDP1950707.1 hypothetical protein [Nitrosomonas sp.]